MDWESALQCGRWQAKAFTCLYVNTQNWNTSREWRRVQFNSIQCSNFVISSHFIQCFFLKFSWLLLSIGWDEVCQKMFNDRSWSISGHCHVVTSYWPTCPLLCFILLTSFTHGSFEIEFETNKLGFTCAPIAHGII